MTDKAPRHSDSTPQPDARREMTFFEKLTYGGFGTPKPKQPNSWQSPRSWPGWAQFLGFVAIAFVALAVWHAYQAQHAQSQVHATISKCALNPDQTAFAEVRIDNQSGTEQPNESVTVGYYDARGVLGGEWTTSADVPAHTAALVVLADNGARFTAAPICKILNLGAG